MTSWSDFAAAEPDLAARARALFDAGRHKTIATLRADGSPRLSGIECEFTETDLRFGSMLNARKLDDLRRDGRFALHGPTFHPDIGAEHEWTGEAKVGGTAIPAGPVLGEDPDGPPQGEWFAADISEVVVTGLNADATKLRVEWWTPAGGRQVVERE